MRYNEIKSINCSHCEALLEQELTFSRQNFYSNMDLLKKQGISSDLEGIDTIVRLGYLEKYSPREIFNRFRPLHPIRGAREYGSFNQVTGEISYSYDHIFDQIQVTQTLAHELRHRAFNIISNTPELDSLMPNELKKEWSNGYGKFQQHVREWNYEGVFASPEHAMIYAVQFADPLKDKSYFFTNPALKGKTVDYWRNLYRSIESAVKQWFEKNVAKDTEQFSKSSEFQPVLTLDPKMKSFFDAYAQLDQTKKLNLFSVVNAIHIDFKIVMTNINVYDNSLRNAALEVVEIINANEYSKMPTALDNFWRTAIGLNEQDKKKIQEDLRRFEATGIPWKLLDPTTFTSAEFNALTNLGNPVQPVPVERVPTVSSTPSPAPATSATGRNVPRGTPPDVVSPTGNKIGFYQFAVQNQFANQSLWSILQSARDWKSLETWINGAVRYQAGLVGLYFSPDDRAKLDAMFKILQNKPYNFNEAAQMLARIELTKK